MNGLRLLLSLMMATAPAWAEDGGGKPVVPDVKAIPADPRARVLMEAADENEEPANVGLILDSSGSMGQILEGNKSKMFFMKQLMKGFIAQQWRLKNEIGVRIYGSRKKHDCDDISMAIPYSDHSLGTLQKSLEVMSPVGMTPLHKTIQMTVDEIKKRKGPKKVVIITDGEDTCGGDPCKTADAVRSKGLDVTFYVVALGYSGKSDSLQKMKCLGDVQSVNDAQSFGDAMSNISRSINKPPNLRVISPNPDATAYLFQIDEKGERHMVRGFIASVPQSVPPGNYDVVVALQPAYKFENVEVVPKKKITLKVEGEGQVIANYFKGFVKAHLLDKDNKVVMKFRTDQQVTAPAGKWKLRLFRDPFFDRVIPDFYVYPRGNHQYDLSGVGVVRVDSPKLLGLYVYDQDKTLVGHSLTGFPMVLKTGIYSIHVDQNCTFDKVEVREKKEVLVLECRPKN